MCSLHGCWHLMLDMPEEKQIKAWGCGQDQGLIQRRIWGVLVHICVYKIWSHTHSIPCQCGAMLPRPMGSLRAVLAAFTSRK